MIFNTIYTSSASPISPSGDATKYPMVDIPVGSIKLYEEQKISNIGESIQAIMGSSSTYTTEEMSSTLQTARGCLDDINDAINEIAGYAPGTVINISDMAEAIQVETVSINTFITNCVISLGDAFQYSSYGGCIFRYDHKHYLIASIMGQGATLAISLSRSTRNNLMYDIRWLANGGSSRLYFINTSTSMYSQGREIWNPIDTNSFFGASRTWAGNGDEYSGGTNNQPFYDKDCYFYNLSSNNLPVILEKYGNGNSLSIKDLLSNIVIFKDMFTISIAGVVGIVVINLSSWESANSVLYITDMNNQVYYIQSSGQFYIRSGFYWGNLTEDFLHSKNPVAANWRTRNYAYSVSIADLTSAVIWNTYDILDENGNVVIPANATLESLGYL